MATVTCPGCLERDKRIAALERRVAELEVLVRDLHARLGANATNSCSPPSANPPGAPKPVTKKPTGKKPGGQPGHPPHLQRRLPPERSMRSSRSSPATATAATSPCRRSPAPATPSRPGIRSPNCPSWRRRSPSTRATTAPAPAAAAQPRRHPAGAQGPQRRPASGRHPGLSGRQPPRQQARPGGDRRGRLRRAHRVGDGRHLRSQMSAALAPAHAEACQAVREAAVKNVDETSWKLAGKLCWLWVAATQHRGRLPDPCPPRRRRPGGAAGRAGRGPGVQRPLERLRPAVAVLPPGVLGASEAGLPEVGRSRRGGGAAGAGVAACRERVFVEWHLFRGGGGDRQALQRRLDGPARRLERWLQGGAPLRRQRRRRRSARTCWRCCRRCGGSW